VASVPDVRLQVYFMSHDGYFDRTGHTDADGNAFEDNATRALFFNRSVLETLRKLRWAPDLVHAFGWISGLLPILLSTTYADDDLLGGTKSVFTPGHGGPDTRLQASFGDSMNLPLDGDAGATLSEIGHAHADATVLAPNGASSSGASPENASTLPEESGPRTEHTVALYDQMLSEVPA
jgi:starch synthase